MNKDESKLSEKVKAIIYIGVGAFTLMGAAASAVIWVASIGDRVEDHERRLVKAEDTSQIHARREVEYKKDIEQIRDAIKEMKDSFKEDITELIATNVKILETLFWTVIFTRTGNGH